MTLHATENVPGVFMEYESTLPRCFCITIVLSRQHKHFHSSAVALFYYTNQQGPSFLPSFFPVCCVPVVCAFAPPYDVKLKFFSLPKGERTPQLRRVRGEKAAGRSADRHAGNFGGR